MARPTKSADIRAGHHSKEERASRKANEEKLKSGNDVSPPRHLTKDQKKIWKFIVEGLKQADILCNLDDYIMELAAVSIDRIQQLNKMVNQDAELLIDRDIRGTMEHYSKIFFRVCNELCLSPQARAKLANAMAQGESSADQIKRILAESDDDEE